MCKAALVLRDRNIVEKLYLSQSAEHLFSKQIMYALRLNRI